MYGYSTTCIVILFQRFITGSHNVIQIDLQFFYYNVSVFYTVINTPSVFIPPPIKILSIDKTS